MFRSHGTARRLCLVLLFLALTGLCAPTVRSSASTPAHALVGSLAR